MNQPGSLDGAVSITFETDSELYEWLRTNSPFTIILEELEAALVGAVAVAPGLYSLVYDYDEVLKVLQADFKMGYDDSVVYFSNKLFPLYENHGNPIFTKALAGVSVDKEPVI